MSGRRAGGGTVTPHRMTRRRPSMKLCWSGAATALFLMACGARSVRPGPGADSLEASTDDATDAGDEQSTAPDSHAERSCVPVSDQCASTEVCGNGLDDNCNGSSDEGCHCSPGSVQ